jgi:hypothetical protein
VVECIVHECLSCGRIFGENTFDDRASYRHHPESGNHAAGGAIAADRTGAEGPDALRRLR